MKINIFTLFPEIIEVYINSSILKKAQEKSLVSFKIINIRNYSYNKHNKIDDIPFGGGHGMIIKPDVVGNAIDANCLKNEKIFYPSPRGQIFNQNKAKEISIKKNVNELEVGTTRMNRLAIDFYRKNGLTDEAVILGMEINE